MSEIRFALAIRIIPLVLVCVALFLSTAQVQCDTYDDDRLLEFYWDAASGNVHHYNVYLSIDEADYFLTGITPVAPTKENPYVVPVSAEDGKKYQLKVEAEDVDGRTGPMSEPSGPVWCKLRSPGDANGLTPGDADGDLRVSARDWAILGMAWGTQRGDALFDYKADLNYDDSVNISDVVIVAINWGNLY